MIIYPANYNLISSRKVLASNFDFTPFLNHHQQREQKKRHHQKGRLEPDMQASSEPVEDHEGKEIDPRYGVEKRRVPTGPNPLHH